jgi:DNA polymerase IV
MDTAVDRYIAHIDLDSFFVSVERLRNPALVGQPVIIGGSRGRGVVASCSYEARQFGVHSAMPGGQARRLCPQGIFLRGDMAAYSEYSGVVRDLIAAEAPLFEQASIDEFYLDLSGLDKFFGAWEWARQLRRKLIQATGLPMSMGVSTSKVVSKIATGQAKPNGELWVPPGTERQFLAPLPVHKMPFLGGKMGEKLHSLGIHTLGQLQTTPPAHLEQLFGKHGVSLQQRACGIDSSAVEPYAERKSISKEHTFEQDIADVAYLATLIRNMTEKLAFKLRKSGFLAGGVAIKLRYPGFETHTRQATLPPTTDDRKLMKLALHLFKLAHNGKPLRLVGVRLGNLTQGSAQANLFEDTAKQSRLYQAMDKLKLKHGTTAVSRASGWFQPEERPETSTPNLYQTDPEADGPDDF